MFEDVMKLAALGLVLWGLIAAADRDPERGAGAASRELGCIPGDSPSAPASGLPPGATIGGNVAPDGTEIQIDLPGDLHVKNRGGSDGAGLCVFASMHHSGVWSDEPVFDQIFEFMFRRPGGSHPAKTDAMIALLCRERGLPKPHYIQIEGSDVEILKLACRSGRMPAVTYSFSPSGRYNRQRIAHMVNLVHADDRWFAILDNNYPGPQRYEWLTPDEFRRSYTGGRSGWAIIPLRNGPPPPPQNQRAVRHPRSNPTKSRGKLFPQPSQDIFKDLGGADEDDATGGNRSRPLLGLWQRQT